MVVPMMKYSFLVLKSEHEKFLDRLGELGVLDVTIHNYTPSDLELELIGRLKELQLLHNRFMFSKNEYEAFVKDAVPFEGNIKDLEQLYKSTADELEQSSTKTIALNEAYTISSHWGNFSVEGIERLKKHGLTLRYFASTAKVFSEEFQSEYMVEEISRTGNNIYFVLVVREGEEYISDIKNCKELQAPKTPLAQINGELAEQAKLHTQLSEKFASLIGADDIIKQEVDRLKEILEHNKIRNSNIIVAEGSLAMVDGWVPQEKCKELDPIFEQMDTTLYFKDKPTIDDEPPVLLKNNAFARSAEVVTKLYALPKYDEVDMTSFFAPFFMLFVGMCLGDIGYGAILFTAAIVAKIKMKDKSMKDVINLVLFCSISTMIVGFITGVFFGASLSEMGIFSSIKWLFIPSKDMFTISLAIGVIQIVYALTLRTIIRMRRYGILYGFASLGWVMTIVATICAMMLPKVGVTDFATDSIAYYIVMGVAGVLMFFFQDPKKNIFMNFGMGIWELYNNLTGLLGDVLSYVRLFALGLSGSAIAGVFNELAISMSGDIPVLKYVFMIMIMLAGHSINLFMSAIGSLVHPLRLTFVEFYKNVGFEGGGREYSPFKKRNN